MKWFRSSLKQLHNESGFTLIELIITISLIAIAAGISGFGLSAIFNAQEEAMTHEIVTDINNVRYRAVSEFDTGYQLVLTYDSTSEKYGYKIERFKVGDSSPTAIKNEDYSSRLVLERLDPGSGVWIELNDASIDITTNPNQGTFCFAPSDGSINQYVLNSSSTEVKSLNNSTTETGLYRVRDTQTNGTKEFEVIGFTGRVLIDD